MGGRQHDVVADERARAEVEPLTVDLQLEHADVLVDVVRIVRAADHGAGWTGDEEDDDGDGRRKERCGTTC